MEMAMEMETETEMAMEMAMDTERQRDRGRGTEEEGGRPPRAPTGTLPILLARRSRQPARARRCCLTGCRGKSDDGVLDVGEGGRDRSASGEEGVKPGLTSPLPRMLSCPISGGL